MKDSAPAKRGSSALMILLVVFVFMVCSLFLIMYGADVYRKITARSDADFTRRMCVSFITNKIRACEVRGGVEILPGGAGLRLRSDPETPLYVYIYCFDGYIVEYITDLPEEFEPENGEAITPASSLSVREVPGGIEVTVGAPDGLAGEVAEMAYTVSLRCY